MLENNTNSNQNLSHPTKCGMLAILQILSILARMNTPQIQILEL